MYFIFDFDGTLVDSFMASIEIYNLLAEKNNFNKIEHSKIEDVKNISAFDLIRTLNIPFYRLPTMLYHAQKNMSKSIHTLPPFFNIKEMLNTLHESGCKIGILTSNSKENVDLWLKLNGIASYFTFIHSERNLFGKDYALKKIFRTYNIDKDEAVYIGDEARDIEAAKKLNMKSIAVTWGFNTEQFLLKQNPDYIARTPQDIVSLIPHINGVIKKDA